MGVFKKPKKPKPPPLPAPQAVPETTEQPAESAVRAAQRRRGFQQTILTGALAPSTGKKSVLG